MREREQRDGRREARGRGRKGGWPTIVDTKRMWRKRNKGCRSSKVLVPTKKRKRSCHVRDARNFTKPQEKKKNGKRGSVRSSPPSRSLLSLSHPGLREWWLFFFTVLLHQRGSFFSTETGNSVSRSDPSHSHHRRGLFTSRSPTI